MKRLTLVFITIIALLSNTANSQDQKAVEILESIQDRYQQSIKNIDDYVMETGNHTIFYKKAFTNDGMPYFKTKTKGGYMDEMETTSNTNKDLYSQFSAKVKEKAIYKGTDMFEGNKVQVIFIEQMELEGFNPDNDTENKVEDIYLYIDSDQLVVRKMKYKIETKIKDGEVTEVSPVVINRDFRNVEGMLIPFESVTIVKGMNLTDEERKEIEKGLNDFEEKMKEMPESQREMMEQMAGGKIKKYRTMIENDQYKNVRKIEKIEVNTGMGIEDF